MAKGNDRYRTATNQQHDQPTATAALHDRLTPLAQDRADSIRAASRPTRPTWRHVRLGVATRADRKSTRLNSSHVEISYAVFCLKKKKDRPHKSISSLRKYVSTTKTKESRSR